MQKRLKNIPLKVTDAEGVLSLQLLNVCWSEYLIVSRFHIDTNPPNLRCSLRDDPILRTREGNIADPSQTAGLWTGACTNSAEERKVPVKLKIQYEDTGDDWCVPRFKYKRRLIKTSDTKDKKQTKKHLCWRLCNGLKHNKCAWMSAEGKCVHSLCHPHLYN